MFCVPRCVIADGERGRMSLGWVEDVVRDGKVVLPLQSTQTEKKSEVNGSGLVNSGMGEQIEIEAQDSVGPPPTMLSDSAIAA